jgi:hypothetical protein
LSKSARTRALCLNVQTETYIATLLAKPVSLSDLRVHAPERVRRLQTLGLNLQTPLYSLSPGQLAALSWLVESWSQRKALLGEPERVIAVDFDQLLGDLRGVMGRVLAHFGLPHDSETLAALARSPALSRYSKAQQKEYSPLQRLQILTDSRKRNRQEIAKGLSLVDRIASSHAEAAAVIAQGLGSGLT